MGRRKIQDSKVIEDFKNKYCKSESAKYNYPSCLRHYFKTLGISDPDQYFTMGRNYDTDILTYAESMSKDPAKSFNVRLAAIKNLLIRTDIPIKPSTWKDAIGHRQGSRAITFDRTPTQQELQDILQYADLKLKALILVLSSSGMRIGEALQITEEDLNSKTHPVTIKIRASYTKSGDGRITFISDEASDCLKSWLTQRKSYLQVAVKRINFAGGITKDVNDPRIFPFTNALVRYFWNQALEKSKLDQKDTVTRIHELHIHVLRKFFLSNLKLKVPEPIVEKLAGHASYLSDAYSRYNEKQMGEEYLKGMSSLSIYEKTPDLSNVTQRLGEKDLEIKALQEQIKQLDNAVRRLSIDKLEELDRKIKKK